MEFQIVSKQENKRIFSATLAENSSVFSGHFPGLPIVPGVSQVDWAMTRSQCWYSLENFYRLDKLKFKQVMIPGDKLVLVLENLGCGEVSFTYRCDDELLSSGRLVFRI